MEPPVGVVSNTVAPATEEPEGSVTWPRIAAVGACAARAAAAQKSRRPARQTKRSAFLYIREFIRSVVPFLIVDGARRASWSAGVAAAAVIQTPRRKNGRSLPLRRSLQYGFNSSQYRDRRRFRRVMIGSRNDHHRIALLKIR